MGEAFLNWYSENLDTVKPSLMRFSNNEEALSVVLLKVYERLNKRPAGKPVNFKNYLFIAFRNQVYQSSKTRKTTPIFPDLGEDPEELGEELARRERRETVVKDIYKYVSDNFPPIESGLFKFYYKNNFTFVKIAELTGYSKTNIHEKVSKVRAAVKNEFKTFQF